MYLLTGANGSGKSSLARAWAEASPRAQLLSAESQQAFYERELQRDESNFRQGVDFGTTVAALLGEAARSHPLLASFRLAPLWTHGYRSLSTGEARKLLLLHAVLAAPSLLVLDEPFEGLDVAAVADLSRAIVEVAEHVPVLLVGSFGSGVGLGPRETLPVPIDALREVIVVDHSQVVFRGDVSAWRARGVEPAVGLGLRAHPAAPVQLGSSVEPLPPSATLVELHRGRIQYDERVIFEDLELSVHVGQHTLIEGPNGSGKSSLLEMITGDHPQAYGNDLTLFGRRRGTGESIWDIKKNIGSVSSRLHRDYRVGGSVESVLLSGLYDSIGVYQAPSPLERERARAWLAWLDLGLAPGDAFAELSHGFQRMVLVARAAIKLPPLVVLDEPTNGLDPENSARVLELVRSLCEQHVSTILFVTHRPDEREYWVRHIGGATLSLGR